MAFKIVPIIPIWSAVIRSIPIVDASRPRHIFPAPITTPIETPSSLEKGDIVIFGGGTGSPYFSTDTTAALRALEIGATKILMAKNGVDGVYDSDPKTNKEAKRFAKITYDELLKYHLQVMDLTAATLCSDNNVETIVFDMGVKGNIKKVIEHPEIGTIISK